MHKAHKGTFSNPPRAFILLIYIGVCRGKHVTQILPIDWS